MWTILALLVVLITSVRHHREFDIDRMVLLRHAYAQFVADVKRGIGMAGSGI